MRKPFDDRFIREMSDQDVQNRYCEEMLKLKRALWSRRHGERPVRNYRIWMMNLCRRELRERGLPIPQVHLPEEE